MFLTTGVLRPVLLLHSEAKLVPPVEGLRVGVRACTSNSVLHPTGLKIVPIADNIARPDWTGRPDRQFDKSVANTGLKVSLGIRSKP